MMMSSKIVELLKKLPKKSVALIGGSSLNKTMIHYLSQEIQDLFIPEQAPYFEAMGVAIWALDNPTALYSWNNRCF